MGKGPVEDHADVSHRVDTHSRALEDRPGGKDLLPPFVMALLGHPPSWDPSTSAPCQEGQHSPRSGEHSVDNRVLGVLSLLDEDVLLGQKDGGVTIGKVGRDTRVQAEQLPMKEQEAGGSKGVPSSAQGGPQACKGREGSHPSPRTLTELVEVCLNSIGSRHRADEPGLQEGAPLVHKAAVAPVVILQQ